MRNVQIAAFGSSGRALDDQTGRSGFMHRWVLEFFFSLPPYYVSIDENDDQVLSFFNTAPSNDDYKVVYN